MPFRHVGMLGSAYAYAGLHIMLTRQCRFSILVCWVRHTGMFIESSFKEKALKWFKDYAPLYGMENMNQECRQCSKCKKSKTLDNYRPDRQLCNQCLEEKARYRENHREELREKAKEYYQDNKDKKKEYNERTRERRLEKKKEYRTRTIECPYCFKTINLNNKSSHDKTKKHQTNLTKQNETETDTEAN